MATLHVLSQILINNLAKIPLNRRKTEVQRDKVIHQKLLNY